jgi:uncharacterized membrane protein YdjX (TVP38/TMEM64 family)
VRISVLAAAIATALLVLFAVALALDVPVLTDERPSLGAAGPAAALASVGLLVADVVLPVPSSGVMLANGAIFGMVPGALLSLAGSVGAACFGWWLGRRGERAFGWLADESGRSRAARMLDRRGVVAIALSRPVPVLAETLSILAGATGMPLPRLLASALLGSVPPAIGYGLAGAAASGAHAGAYVFTAVIALSAILWFADR